MVSMTSVPVVPRRESGGAPSPSPLAPAARPKASAAYLRDTRSGVIASRPSFLREHREDVRAAWRRSAGLAMELIQNSGRLRGACDQIIADTVGVELQLNPQPDPAVMARLGYDSAAQAQFRRDLKAWWKRWSWSPAECDQRGKLTVPQMVDVGLRWNLAFGEVTGILGFMSRAARRRYGIESGTKVTMIPPMRLVQDTNETERMFQGVLHDGNGRPVAYRVEERDRGLVRRTDWPARDVRGRPVFMHIFEPMDADDVRGISGLAASFLKSIQYEQLDAATLQTAILQTVHAIVLTSDLPSREAFEALEELKASGNGGEIADDLLGMLGAQLDRARDSAIHVSAEPKLSHLAPGENLELKGVAVPGSQYLPFAKSLSRDAARALGISYAGYTLDFEGATYSSTRMENASIWPVTMRRRERIAGQQCQMIYEAALEEAIAEGRFPFRGGYAAFAANRDAITWAQWQGPAKPTADDHKSARAASERILNGTSSLAIEAAELGHDEEELFEQRRREHERYVSAGLPSPYAPRQGAAVTEPEPAGQQREETMP